MVGGLCLGDGMVKMAMHMKDGSTQTQDFRYTEVAESVSGRWAYTFDHVSAPMKMAPLPAAKAK